MRTFAAPMPTVFYAVIGVLMAEGYEIASSDPQQGVIVTKPMAINTGGAVTARAYRVTVTADGETRSRVIASPSLYAGARDVSSRELWDLDGPRGEHTLWHEMFADIDSVIVRPTLDASQREALAKVAVKPPAEAPNDKTGGQNDPGFTPATLTPDARAQGRRLGADGPK